MGRAMPDLLTSPSAGQRGGGNDQPVQLVLPIDGIPLVGFCETKRFRELDRLESYYRKRQDAHKSFDWDGYFNGYGEAAPIKPGWFIPYGQRRPMTRYDLAALIVTRITSFLFGADKFPELKAEGDEDAEQCAKALAVESKLPQVMIGARNLGGAVGAVCLSWGVVNGTPRVRVRNAKHVTVLRWADEDERVVGAAVLAYSYRRQVYDPTTKKLADRVYYYARYWDEQIERIWEPIPAKVAETPWWTSAVPSRTSVHGFGFTPLYWIQNKPDECEADGPSDYDGLTDNFDTVNQLLSATAKGTRANVEPTTVVREDPALNTGTLFKGGDNVIWSRGGAEYLELKGDAVKAAKEVVAQLRLFTLEVASVVLADPDKVTGSAQSAAALRILYAPMLAEVEIRREQYGAAISRILVDMLKVMRLFKSRPPGVDVEGNPVQEAIILPKRLVKPERPKRDPMEPPGEVDDDELEPVEKDHDPGTSERLTLNWNPAFPPTWDDIAKATDAAQKAAGGKALISRKTATASIQSLFGVEDVDAELDAIDEDAELAMGQAARAMAAEGGPEPFGTKPGDKRPGAGDERADAEDEDKG